MPPRKRLAGAPRSHQARGWGLLSHNTRTRKRTWQPSHRCTLIRLRRDARQADRGRARLRLDHQPGRAAEPDRRERDPIHQPRAQRTSDLGQFAHHQPGLDSYPILNFSEAPDVEVVLINRPDQPAMGAGEPSTVTTAPAIANAIYAATGARVREIPFTPQCVRAAARVRP